VNEAVDRILEEREAMDRGFPGGMLLSGAFHLLLVGAALGAAWLESRKPLIQVAPGFVVQMPRGGGGPVEPEPAPAAAPPVTTQAAPAPEPPAPAPPPKVIKPPKEEPRKGLPPPDAKRTKPKPEKSAPPTRVAAPPAPERATSARGAAAGTGHSSATPGLGLVGPPGVGAPDGTDNVTDWYLAAVQQRIWVLWARQIRASFSQPVRLTFTILADGTLEDGSVQILQPSDVQLIDLAAKRAIFSAAPFSPLPKSYGTNRITIQARFEPTP
jgi:periplasmic protein TonB